MANRHHLLHREPHSPLEQVQFVVAESQTVRRWVAVQAAQQLEQPQRYDPHSTHESN